MAAALLVIGGCQGTPRPGDEHKAPSPTPLAVLLDGEIEGEVLGQRLQSPAGLAVDQRGILTLVDAGNDRLVRFDMDLNPQRDVGGFGSQPGLFDDPGYITVDNDLNLYVSDAGNLRICRYNNRLAYVDEITLEDDDDPLKYGRPSGVALTDYGEAWVCDKELHRLIVFDNIGRFSRFVGEFGYSGGGLHKPEKVVRDKSDHFWVCDAGNSRIVVYDEYGNFEYEIFHELFDYPKALVFDPAGRVWVLDAGTNLLFCLNRKGEELLVSGPLITGSDRPLKAPADLAFTADGRLVISDSGNHRLMICRIVFESE